MRIRKKKKLLLSWLLLGILLTGCVTKADKVMATFPEVVDTVSNQIKPSVVYVEINMAKKTNNIKLNGLVIREDGLILVPNHIEREDLNRITVWVDKKEYKASLVQSDKKLRISLVKIEPESRLTPAILGDATAVKPGEWLIGVRNLGKLHDYKKMIELGIVAGKTEEELYETFHLQLSKVYQPGMPFVNLKGEVVGLAIPPANGEPEFRIEGLEEFDIDLSQILSRDQRNQIVQINQIKRGIEKLLAKATQDATKTKVEKIEEEKRTPWLGIRLDVLNEDYAKIKNLPAESVWVKHVFANTPAAAGGLKANDLIIEVDGQAITKRGNQALQQFFRYLEPELHREVSFKVLRNGQTLLIKCKFGPKPEPKEFKAEDIGITVKEITEVEYFENNLHVKEGVLVTKIEQGSPAATSDLFGRALINLNEVIVEFYNISIKTFDDFIKAIEIVRRDNPEVILVKLWRGNYLVHVALNLKIGKREK